MTIEEQLKQLYQDDKNELMRAEDRLKGIYEALPYQLQVTSELTGISQEQLILMAKRTAFTHAHVEWHQIIDLMHTMYIYKRSLDKEAEV